MAEQVIVLSGDDVRENLSIGLCIDLMEQALTATSSGNATQPLRQVIDLPGRDGLISLMPGFIEGPECLGTKVVTVYPANFEVGRPSHQGIIVLFDAQSGAPSAILDATSVTAIRTAAASGLATRLLARKNSRALAILGYGEQASAHLEAMMNVRALEEVRVWGREPRRRQAFAERETEKHGVRIIASQSTAEAVAGADIVCTTTAARTPILHSEMIEPGMHLNVVGSSIPSTREIDAATFAMARVFVDYKEATLAHGGDYLAALNDGLVDDTHIAGEVGEIILHKVEGRKNDDEITMFKSLGISSQDLVSSGYLARLAKEKGLGSRVYI